MSWPMFEYVTRQAQHMDCMMERLDVDVVAATRHQRGQAFADARSNCLHCPFARDCTQWMQRAAGGGSPAEYCPNASFFAAFQRKPVDVEAVNGK